MTNNKDIYKKLFTFTINKPSYWRTLTTPTFLNRNLISYPEAIENIVIYYRNLYNTLLHQLQQLSLNPQTYSQAIQTLKKDLIEMKKLERELQNEYIELQLENGQKIKVKADTFIKLLTDKIAIYTFHGMFLRTLPPEFLLILLDYLDNIVSRQNYLEARIEQLTDVILQFEVTVKNLITLLQKLQQK